LFEPLGTISTIPSDCADLNHDVRKHTIFPVNVCLKSSTHRTTTLVGNVLGYSFSFLDFRALQWRKHVKGVSRPNITTKQLVYDDVLSFSALQ